MKTFKKFEVLLSFCLPQILLGPFLNTLTQMAWNIGMEWVNISFKSGFGYWSNSFPKLNESRNLCILIKINSSLKIQLLQAK